MDVIGVDELVIHGESIGGMAAAGAARALTTTTTAVGATSTTPTKSKSVSTLLICDRTFCNLEAIAQRLVGQWTGNAIRLLTPGWSTDVARDYLEAQCSKICANDCADEIIHDYHYVRYELLTADLSVGYARDLDLITLVKLFDERTDFEHDYFLFMSCCCICSNFCSYLSSSSSPQILGRLIWLLQ